jgi:hypothetical protein
LKQNRKKLVKDEEITPNMPLLLEIMRKNAIEGKVDKYKGLFGVPFLIGNKKMEPKMLREITNDAITPKKRDKKVQNDLYEKKEDADFYEGLDYEVDAFTLS